MIRSVAFERVYRRNGWNGTETYAGPGSTEIATARLRRELPGMLRRYEIRSILDAGCAESYWMPDLPGYVGVDIVPGAIASARARFPGRDFRVADIVVDDLPRADAVLCRDVLQHLPLADGRVAIENFRRAGARFLLSSTHEGGENRNVPPGRWFAIDLEAKPFAFGPPLESFPDGTWDSGVAFPSKRFGVWAL